MVATPERVLAPPTLQVAAVTGWGLTGLGRYSGYLLEFHLDRPGGPEACD